MIRVGTGVVIRGAGLQQRLLLTQRGTRSDFPFAWESPGGKLDEDESVLEGVCRELREEVNLAATFRSDDPLWANQRHDATTWSAITPEPLYEHRFAPGEAGPVAVAITFHIVRPPDAWTPRASDPNVMGLGWFTWEEMGRVSFMPGNVKLYEAWKRGDLTDGSVYW